MVRRLVFDGNEIKAEDTGSGENGLSMSDSERRVTMHSLCILGIALMGIGSVFSIELGVLGVIFMIVAALGSLADGSAYGRRR